MRFYLIQIFISFLLIYTTFVFTGCREEDDLNNCISISEENQNLLLENLVGYYPLNNTIVDESGFNNIGEATSITPTIDRNMACDGAFYFNGTDSGITIPDSEQLSFGESFTISAWINTEKINTQQIVGQEFYHDVGYRWPFALALSATNDFIFSISTNNGENLFQARKSGYLKDTWYLITGVFENQKIHLYINGELEAEKEVEGEFFDDELDLHIGIGANGEGQRFHGIIDDVRIYDRALSQADVLLLSRN